MRREEMQYMKIKYQFINFFLKLNLRFPWKVRIWLQIFFVCVSLHKFNSSRYLGGLHSFYTMASCSHFNL